ESTTVSGYDPDAAQATIRDLRSGRERVVAAGAIVLVTPREQVPFDGSRLESPTTLVGDARAPRTIDAAIVDGFDTAFSLGAVTGPSGSTSVSISGELR